jgi:hypothetical protein
MYIHINIYIYMHICVCIYYYYVYMFFSHIISGQIRSQPEERHCFAAQFRQARELVSRGMPVSDALASVLLPVPTHRSHFW